MQTPEPIQPPPRRGQAPRPTLRHGQAFLPGIDVLPWLAGLVLCLSSFMGWYSGPLQDTGGEKVIVSITGWHTGWVGQLFFVCGLALLALLALERIGIELPASVPASLVVIGIGVISTILVLIRLTSIPDKFLPADGRAIGIWIALAAALGVLAAGLLQASEE